MICEWNLLFWRPDLAYFREKRDSTFNELVGPVKNKIIQQVGHKVSKRFTQADYSNTKAHTPSIKLAIYSDICWLLSFSSTSFIQITVVSLASPQTSFLFLCHAFISPPRTSGKHSRHLRSSITGRLGTDH